MERDVCLEQINSLEVVKRYKLQNTEIARTLTDFLCRYYNKQIGATEFLNTLVESVLAYQAGNKDKDGKQLAISLTPDVLLTSDFLAEKITPWVELVRTELFSSPRIPFANLKDAENWIREQEKEQPSPTQIMHRPDYQQAVILLMKAYAPYRFMFPIQTWRSLEYLRHDGKPSFATITEPAPRDWIISSMREDADKYTRLNWLENETRLMCEATGFNQPSLVQFVLMDTPPIVPRYRIGAQLHHQQIPSRPEHKNGLGYELLRASYVDIRVSVQDLTFEELRELYNSYRGILQLKKHKLREGKELAKSHWEISQLVKERRGPPKGKGVVAFWESIKEELNKRDRQNKYKTWKGVKLAYDRIIDRLERRVTSKLDKSP